MEKKKEYHMRAVGSRTEELAAAFLERHNMVILERNFRSRQGEIDLIGLHNGYLVFIEVKSRFSLKKGSPEDAVNHGKQRTICRVADYYRFENGISEFAEMRYDCVTIDEGKISWIKNAFEHVR